MFTVGSFIANPNPQRRRSSRRTATEPPYNFAPRLEYLSNHGKAWRSPWCTSLLWLLSSVVSCHASCGWQSTCPGVPPSASCRGGSLGLTIHCLTRSAPRKQVRWCGSRGVDRGTRGPACNRRDFVMAARLATLAVLLSTASTALAATATPAPPPPHQRHYDRTNTSRPP